KLLSGTNFTIVSPTSNPFTIAANDSVMLRVITDSLPWDRAFIDTVEIELECSKWKIPVFAETGIACLTVTDLDFGTRNIGESKTLPLRFCNDGAGEITFNNPANGPELEWLSEHFSVAPADLTAITNARLRRGECITINVSFKSDTVGVFQTTARFWASTRNCRDTSVWIARAVAPAAAPIETGAINSLSVNEPNPFTNGTDIAFNLARGGHTTLVVYNARGERVATLVDGERAAGRHAVRFDAVALPAGVYNYRLSVGVWSETRTMMKR
ncbi:MAG: T9SS type A sorting domain-containing protein, partial [bacterium]|nr:T9SS type A sorting domain-containing protein [Candidatus Kapabacteria bacterium]